MDLTSILPPRTIEDILAERVRLVIGGRVYDLPALSVRDNREWKAQMRVAMAGLLDVVEDEPGAVIDALASDDRPFIDLLISYDKTGSLPPAEDIEEALTPMGVFLAVLEVWRAANPKVDTGLMAMAMSPTTSGSGEPTSSSSASTAGPTDTSSAN